MIRLHPPGVCRMEWFSKPRRSLPFHNGFGRKVFSCHSQSFELEPISDGCTLQAIKVIFGLKGTIDQGEKAVL